jgi:hypothetical protein
MAESLIRDIEELTEATLADLIERDTIALLRVGGGKALLVASRVCPPNGAMRPKPHGAGWEPIPSPFPNVEVRYDRELHESEWVLEVVR